MLMALCRQKVTKPGKMCWFFARLIENSAFAIFLNYESFASTNWYRKATAPTSTVLLTLSNNMTQRHGIDPQLRYSN